MQKLSEYLRLDNKVERLTEFLDDCGQWQVDYNEHVDFLDSYYDLVEAGTIYYDNIDDCETKVALKFEVERKGIDFLFDNDLIIVDLHCGINRRSDELWSYSLGEQEVQFTGLYDYSTRENCVYNELVKDLTEEEILTAKNKCDYYVGSSDYLYIDSTYDRVSFTLKEDKFIEYLRDKAA